MYINTQFSGTEPGKYIEGGRNIACDKLFFLSIITSTYLQKTTPIINVYKIQLIK
jgi:hypothetical protein